MMSPAAMISVAGFEELQNSAREQFGAGARRRRRADDAPLSNGLRLSFGTADGEPTTFQFVPTLYDTVYPTPIIKRHGPQPHASFETHR